MFCLHIPSYNICKNKFIQLQTRYVCSMTEDDVAANFLTYLNKLPANGYWHEADMTLVHSWRSAASPRASASGTPALSRSLSTIWSHRVRGRPLGRRPIILASESFLGILLALILSICPSHFNIARLTCSDTGTCCNLLQMSSFLTLLLHRMPIIVRIIFISNASIFFSSVLVTALVLAA